MHLGEAASKREWLATVAEALRKPGAPLDRADLALVASAMLEKMEPLRREAWPAVTSWSNGSMRKVTVPQAQKDLRGMVRQLDEIGLTNLLVEMALFCSAEPSSPEDAAARTAAARRHRIR
jgi:ParB family chromosome partitioning protein